jgi:hypothetical protein
MAQKLSHTSPKSASVDPLQLHLLQHNVHLETIKTLTTVLQASTPDTPLHQLATEALIHSLQPFKPHDALSTDTTG